MRIVLSSLGHYHPPHRIPNSFFDQLDIGSDAQWVEDRTGIQARHSVMSEEQILGLRSGHLSQETVRSQVQNIKELAARAWDICLRRLNQRLPTIDLVTCGTSVPDFDIPANAATIASAIGVETTAFDINSACSSFVVNLHVQRSMLLAGAARCSALFTPERYSTRLNFSDRSSCVLFGDGSAAGILEVDAPQGLELIDTIVTSTPSKYDLVQIPVGGYFWQNGAAVQKFAITRTIEITQQILQRNGMTLADIHYLVAHQANLRMLSSAVEKLGIPAEKHLYNVDQFGNQGAAGAPCALSANWDRLKSGDVIVMSVVGSGLTWGSALFRKL